MTTEAPTSPPNISDAHLIEDDDAFDKPLMSNESLGETNNLTDAGQHNRQWRRVNGSVIIEQ